MYLTENKLAFLVPKRMLKFWEQTKVHCITTIRDKDVLLKNKRTIRIATGIWETKINLTAK